MAKAKSNQTSKSGRQANTRRGSATSKARASSSLARRNESSELAWLSSPYDLIQRFGSEMDRVLGELGVREGLAQLADQVIERPSAWSPEFEVIENDGQLKIRVDLPGLKKDEIKVEFADDAVTIEGERRRDHEEKGEGFYRSERSYGRFTRVIPLPAGVDPDTATAHVQNGVLQIEMDAPETKQAKTRNLEIGEEPATAKARAAGR